MKSLKFLKAFKLVLKHEGGYSNNPYDPGLETKYGISKKSYPHVDVKNITTQDAEELYFKLWQKFRYEEIGNEKIAVKIFDISVNIGQYFAVKIAQKTLIKQAAKAMILKGVCGIGKEGEKVKNQSEQNYELEKEEKMSARQDIYFNDNVDFNTKDVDGILGTKTIFAINNLQNCDAFLADFEKNVKEYYRSLVEKNQNYGRFLNGWLARAKDF